LSDVGRIEEEGGVPAAAAGRPSPWTFVLGYSRIRRAGTSKFCATSLCTPNDRRFCRMPIWTQKGDIRDTRCETRAVRFCWPLMYNFDCQGPLVSPTRRRHFSSTFYMQFHDADMPSDV